MGALFLLTCAAIFFGLWRKSFAAGWFCWFALELVRRLAVDIATLTIAH